MLTTEDITERKRIEAALAASEVRYRRLFEAAQDGILLLNADTGEIVDANPFLEDLLAYSHDETDRTQAVGDRPIQGRAGREGGALRSCRTSDMCAMRTCRCRRRMAGGSTWSSSATCMR
jgi:PAS domain-containing protein